jgi:hypothetical protein
MTIFSFAAVMKRAGGAGLIYIPQVIDAPRTIFEEDVIGPAFPISGFGLLKMAKRFLGGVPEVRIRFRDWRVRQPARRVMPIYRNWSESAACAAALLIVDNYSQ